MTFSESNYLERLLSYKGPNFGGNNRWGRWNLRVPAHLRINLVNMPAHQFGEHACASIR